MIAITTAMLDDLRRTLADHVDRPGVEQPGVERPGIEEPGVGGLAWSVSTGTERHVGAAGWLDPDGLTGPMPTDAVFRVASLSKPIAAVAALQLVDDGLFALDDPIDDVLPELAGRRVLADPDGPVDGPTVPAERPLTLRDLLTFRCGLGMDFDVDRPQPVLDRMSELGVGVGPTAPEHPPDEYLARLATVPLADQPGTRWRYHAGSDVLSVLIERVRSSSLDVVLAERVLGPLGMVDTAFWVDPDRQDRFGTCRMPDAEGRWVTWDEPATGRWSRPPAFRSGATGLVSTVVDLDRFGRMLLAGGRAADGTAVLSEELVAAMTTNQLTEAQVHAAQIEPGAAVGWGLGVGVRDGVLDAPPGAAIGDYGWDGGLGATWRNDRRRGLCAVLLTTDAFGGDGLPAVLADFWRVLSGS